MCDCDDNNLTPEQQYGMSAGTPCETITVDLLRLYLRPIKCYLKYKMWDRIGSNEQELISAKEYLDDFIARKSADPADCTGVESLVLIRVIVAKMVNLGVCL